MRRGDLKLKSNERKRGLRSLWVSATGLVAILSWSAIAVAQGTDGAVQMLQFVPDVQLPSLAPWCALEAEDLVEVSCDGSHVCGEVSVPCKDPNGGLNLVSDGVSLRHFDRGTIHLRGAPPDSILIVSWLVWGVITYYPDEMIHKQVTFNGTPFIGQLLGETDEPCWSPPGEDEAVFATYWAEVTAAHGNDVNGNFTVQLDGGALNDGREPWSEPIGQTPLAYGPMRNGASLISIYSHPSVPVEAKVVLHETTALMYEGATLQLNLPAVPDEATRIRLLRVGGDGQRRVRDTPVAPFQTKLRFDDGPTVVVAGATSPIDVQSDWQGDDGSEFVQLWDTHTTDAPAALFNLRPGPQIGEVRYLPDNPRGLPLDCVALVLHALAIY